MNNEITWEELSNKATKCFSEQEAKENEEIENLRNNYENLRFEVDFVDAGYAFVERLKVYLDTDTEDSTVVFSRDFLSNGAAEEFIGSLTT